MAINDNSLAILEGLVISSIEGLAKGSDQVTIKTTDGSEFAFLHYQDCCECVSLCDFENDILDFENAVIITAEEVSSSPEHLFATLKEVYCPSESFTWTFYKISTSRGDLWMRWLGESNGYYSESVSFEKL